MICADAAATGAVSCTVRPYAAYCSLKLSVSAVLRAATAVEFPTTPYIAWPTILQADKHQDVSGAYTCKRHGVLPVVSRTPLAEASGDHVALCKSTERHVEL